MIEINIKTDIRRLSREYSRLERRQVPFATSRALNAVAKDVRDRIISRTYPQAFTVRNKAFPKRAFKVVKYAKKTDLRARVGDAIGKDFMKRHVVGGVKTPRGRFLAVPVNAKRTAKGFRKGQSTQDLRNNPRAFVTQSKRGPIIAVRRTKKRFPISVFYGLEKKALIRRTFPFYRAARKEVSLRLRGHFRREMRLAMMPRK